MSRSLSSDDGCKYLLNLGIFRNPNTSGLFGSIVISIVKSGSTVLDAAKNNMVLSALMLGLAMVLIQYPLNIARERPVDEVLLV